MTVFGNTFVDISSIASPGQASLFLLDSISAAIAERLCNYRPSRPVQVCVHQTRCVQYGPVHQYVYTKHRAIWWCTVEECAICRPVQVCVHQTSMCNMVSYTNMRTPNISVCNIEYGVFNMVVYGGGVCNMVVYGAIWWCTVQYGVQSVQYGVRCV